MNDRKVICQECHWTGTEKGVLIGKNPFEPSETINGCPDCKSVDTIVYACDEPLCWAEVSCGTPTENGYRSTCYKHKPKNKPE